MREFFFIFTRAGTVRLSLSCLPWSQLPTSYSFKNRGTHIFEVSCLLKTSLQHVIHFEIPYLRWKKIYWTWPLACTVIEAITFGWTQIACHVYQRADKLNAFPRIHFYESRSITWVKGIGSVKTYRSIKSSPTGQTTGVKKGDKRRACATPRVSLIGRSICPQVIDLPICYRSRGRHAEKDRRLLPVSLSGLGGAGWWGGGGHQYPTHTQTLTRTDRGSLSSFSLHHLRLLA